MLASTASLERQGFVVTSAPSVAGFLRVAADVVVDDSSRRVPLVGGGAAANDSGVAKQDDVSTYAAILAMGPDSLREQPDIDHLGVEKLDRPMLLPHLTRPVNYRRPRSLAHERELDATAFAQSYFSSF